MDVKGNETTLRKIFEVLIRIEKLLMKNETKEEPKKQVLKGNE
jgi:hypothetical protein